jgi:hypothetical protein
VAKGVSPNHVSSQNLVELPFSMMNLVLWKKVAFVLINPFQKGESLALTVTWAKVLDCKYLLRKICTHVPLVFTESLYNHLLSRHLFFTSKFPILRPPWSFGLQMMSHLVSMYFLLISSLGLKMRSVMNLHTPNEVIGRDSNRCLCNTP